MEDAFRIDSAWLQHFGGYARSLHTQSYWDWLQRPINHNSVVVGRGLIFWLEARTFEDVRRSLAAGANAFEPGNDGVTPFMQAYHALTIEKKHYVTCVHPEIVRMLTSTFGCEPTQMEIYGVVTHKRTRRFRFHAKKRAGEVVAKFMEAARRGDLETVRRMVESDEISVDAVDKSTGETALVAALANDKRHVCDYLMKKGAHALGECTVNGRTGSVLLAAVLTGDVELVRQVAANGGLVSAPSVACVLVEAARLGDIEMIETLLGLGVHVAPAGLALPWSIEGADRFNLSSQREMDLWRLLFTAYWFQDKSLIEYLQRTHTELEDLTSNESIGAAFLILAVYQGNEELVIELLRKGASINRRISCGITAMVAAVAVNSMKILQLLLEQGGDTSLTNSLRLVSNDLSLLSMAVHADAIDCVQMLLPLETRPRYRMQAIHEAIKLGRMEIVDFLLAEEDKGSVPFTGISLELCIIFATCPVLLDSLLTRWFPSQLPRSAWNRIFARRCSANINPATGDPALVSVFLAHGVDLTDFTAEGDGNATSTLIRGVIRTHNGHPAIPVVKFLLESGMPSLSVDVMGRTPEQEMDACLLIHRTYDRYRGIKRRLYRQCRDLFAAHSS